MLRPVAPTSPAIKQTQPVLGTARPAPMRAAVRPKTPAKLPKPPMQAQGPNPQAKSLARGKKALQKRSAQVNASLPQAQPGAYSQPAAPGSIPALGGPTSVADDQDAY